MTHLRRAALAFAATAGLLLAPGTAWAGGLDEPLVGDINGDGMADQAVLGGSNGNCFADVSLGLAGGGFAEPTRYTYTASDWPDYCPDMGVIADLSGDGTAEILLTRFYGGGTILIFDSGFAPGQTFSAAQQLPSGIDKADFNGDGLDDIYEQTDEGEGISLFYGVPGGGLVAGPSYPDVWWPNVGVTDLDGDGQADIVMAYRDDDANVGGVRVVFSGTQAVDLVNDPSGSTYYSTSIGDVSGDGRPDVTVSSTDGDGVAQPVKHWISLAGRHELRAAPTARPETVVVRRGGTVTVDVLANDSVTTAGVVSIVHRPWKGFASVGADRQITFVAPRTKGVQHVLYAVTDDGATVTGDLAIVVK